MRLDAYMTSLIAWVAADDRGPASLNIATDSRISWDSGPLRSRTLWDQGQKVFASQREPILVGYVGDVLFSGVPDSGVAAGPWSSS